MFLRIVLQTFKKFFFNDVYSYLVLSDFAQLLWNRPREGEKVSFVNYSFLTLTQEPLS